MRHFGELSGPNDKLGTIGEIPARDIWRRIRLRPRHHIQNLKPETDKLLLDTEDIMIRTRNPYRGIILHVTPHRRQPPQVESIHLLRRLRLVPLTLVDAHHPTALTADATGGQKIRWVGKHHVEAKRELRQRGIAVALNEGEVVGGGFIVRWDSH